MNKYSRYVIVSLVLFFTLLPHRLVQTGSSSTDSLFAAGEPPEFQLAIEDAIRFLKQKYSDKEFTDNGRASIAALALLKADIPMESPEISTTIQHVLNKTKGEKYTALEGAKRVYEAGVDLMLLESADQGTGQFRKQIEIICKFLVKSQEGHGAWDYPSGASADQGDTSMTQYALLGLWSAHKAGIEFSPEVWDRAAQWHLNWQKPNGGWTYHPSRGSGASYPMTTAGICNLLIIRRHLYPNAKGKWGNKAIEPKVKKPQGLLGVLESAPAEGLAEELAEEIEAQEDAGEDVEKSEITQDYQARTSLGAIDASIGRGLAWLNSRFSVDQGIPAFKLYYLYGLERTCALGNINQIGGRDWYREGGNFLVGNQKDETGSWFEAHSGYVAATAFGLMFLTKATAKMLGKKPSFGGLGAGTLQGARGLKDPNAPEEEESEDEKAKKEKMKLPIDKLLADLMNPKEINIAAVQQALVENVNLENREALIAQKETLIKMAQDPRVEVKRTAMWALGRTEDYKVVPLLIAGLLEDDIDVNVEALLSLCFLSRKPNGLDKHDINPLDLIDPALEGDDKKEALTNWRTSANRRWKKWYFSIRPYNERDDIEEALERDK